MEQAKYMREHGKPTTRLNISPSKYREAGANAWAHRYEVKDGWRNYNQSLELHGETVDFGGLNKLLPGSKEFEKKYYPEPERDREVAVDITWKDGHESAIFERVRDPSVLERARE